MDVLTDILDTLHLRSSIYCKSDLNGRWSVAFEPLNCAVFHIIEGAGCSLCIEGHTAPISLHGGDVVVLTDGARHVIRTDLALAPQAMIRLGADTTVTCTYRCYPAVGALTTLVCGTFELQEDAVHPIRAYLPPVLHLSGSDGQPAAWLESTARLIAREAASGRPGSEIVIRRMADVLFIQIIRAWIETYVPDPAEHGIWVTALHDPQVSAALGLMHRNPERAWTVSALAREVALSRSSFAERFARRVGLPPLTYLNGWRLARAADLLTRTPFALDVIAQRVGYQSAAALSKAFKARYGVAPGKYRAQQGERSSA